MGSLCALAASLWLVGGQLPAGAQSDNFDSYSSTAQMTAAGWILSSLNPALVSTTFPAVGSGKGLRIVANPVPNTAPAVGMWYRTNDYTDFYVSIDIVEWPGTDKNQAMVLFARMTDSGTGTVVPNLNPAAAQGVICNYDASQYGENPTDRRQGQLQINRVGANFSTSTRAVAEITFEPGRAYRLVFKGEGTLYIAEAYDLYDLTKPLVTLQADIPDSFTLYGACGFLSFSRQGTVGTTDVTLDNYYAGATSPNLAPAPALSHPIPGTPQVVTRMPAERFANFHPAANGISFTAQTFSANQIDTSATKLILNGVDVSDSLEPLPANASTVTFSTAPGVLAENRVYSGRIELQDTTGALKSVNTFWFDTFTDAFLTNPPVKTIEAEDYNYGGGQWQLDPIPVSGLDTNNVLVNGGSIGYFDMFGSPEVDYHDNRNSPEGSFVDYRIADYVGTAQSNKDINDFNRFLNTPLVLFHQRQKYAEVGVLEYVVARTEPGEWLNYTRSFADTNYLVYLRVGSFGATQVRLDRVTSDPTTTDQATTPLGFFNIPNNIMHINFTYEPLRDSSGAPVVLRLSGTNTLRLTMLGTPGQDNRKPYLNYLLFVPTISSPTIFENFNDGNDTANPVWDRYDPLGGPPLSFPPASFSFPNGGYRIAVPAPPIPDYGAARAGSFLRGAEYTDFYTYVDVIDFDDTVRQVFGVAARINTPGLGSTGGYLFSWEPGGGTLPGTGGDLDITTLVNEAPVGQIELTNSNLHLERGKSYRFVFMGKGFDFEGQVYEHPDLSNPLIRLPANDPAESYPSGRVGLVVASQSSPTVAPDVTFDNFFVTTAEPRIDFTQSGSNLILSWPQIPFRLESNPSLNPATWTQVTSGITQAGDRSVYTVPTAGSQYFRLVYP
ncbi:MAG: hypothetical protein KJ070_05655 [Verrucomicrobia bacterium]|nr:hypothetical protein [Verrucomicrobiota bacterium]